MSIRSTQPLMHIGIIRLLISLPLILIGGQHVVGLAPLLPLLQGAGIPMAEVFAVTVPFIEVVCGVSLLIGFYARPSAVVTLITMAVAMYTHHVFDWPDEPIFALPVAVFCGSILVLWFGAGSFSRDLGAT